jgi:magnesium chelatase subunit D
MGPVRCGAATWSRRRGWCWRRAPRRFRPSRPLPPPPEGEESAPGEAEQDGARSDAPETLLVEAVRAAIPPDVLDRIAAGTLGRAKSGAGAGQGSACARPGGGGRWRRGRACPVAGAAGAGRQPARGDPVAAAAPARSRARRAGPIRFRRDDLRVRRFEERRSSVTVFCVDASGSTAVSRLAEAKGAAELILAQAYVKRADVAVVAFRGEGADVLLPPTRSLTRAKRALAALPGGGGTPLASGLALARQLGEAVAARGSTPVLVFLTDGSANIALDGTAAAPARRRMRCSPRGRLPGRATMPW